MALERLRRGLNYPEGERAEWVGRLLTNNKTREVKQDVYMGTIERFERFIESVNIGLQGIKKVEAMDNLPLNDLEPERLKDLAEKAAYAAASLYRYAELMRELAD